MSKWRQSICMWIYILHLSVSVSVFKRMNYSRREWKKAFSHCTSSENETDCNSRKGVRFGIWSCYILYFLQDYFYMFFLNWNIKKIANSRGQTERYLLRRVFKNENIGSIFCSHPYNLLWNHTLKTKKQNQTNNPDLSL